MSTLQLENIRHPDSTGNALELHSDGTVTVSQVAGSIKADGFYQDGLPAEDVVFSQGTSTQSAAVALWGKDHVNFPGQVHIVSNTSNASAESGDISFWNFTGSSFQKKVTIDKNGTIEAGSAGNTSANYPALRVSSTGVNPEQAAIAIQQATTEGDTIIFADYDPYVEYGINTDNGADLIDITSGAASVNHFDTKTLYNNAGNPRTAKKIASFNLQTGVTKFARIGLHDQSGAQATVWTEANRTGMGDYSSSYVWVDNLYVWNWRGGLDRGWSDYPSITIQNDTGEGPQGEFRIHGIGGVSGADFAIATRCDGGYITGSDSRRKVNIESIPSALDTVLALDGKTFNIVNKELEIQNEVSKSGKKFGFIAQEVEDIIPEAVKYYESEDKVEENGYASAYSIDYPSIVALLTNAVKEQQEIIESLKTRLDDAGL
jgi:hypothetical protein